MDTAAHPTLHHTTSTYEPRARWWPVLEKLVLITPVIRSLFSRYHVVVSATCDIDRLLSGCIQELRSWQRFVFRQDKTAHTQPYIKPKDFRADA
jgi:hypothetical protein